MPDATQRVPSQIHSYFGTDHVVPVGSGTVGLLVAFEVLGVRGKQVIIPALSCPNIAVAVLAAGATPVLADVSIADYNLDPASVERLLTPDVGAIVAVNAFGYPADLEALRRLSSSSDIPLVEDACQSYGGVAADGVLGARGDVGVVSFGYSKPVPLDGGGLLLARDRRLHDEFARVVAAFPGLSWMKNLLARRLMLAGRDRAQLVLARRFGSLRYRFPPGPAARLPAAWRGFVADLVSMREHLSEVRRLLGSLAEVEPFPYRDGDWLPWRLSFKVRDPSAADVVAARLARIGIGVTRLYPPIRNLPVVRPRSLPGAALLHKRTLNLRYAHSASATRRLRDRLRMLGTP